MLREIFCITLRDRVSIEHILQVVKLTLIVVCGSIKIVGHI